MIEIFTLKVLYSIFLYKQHSVKIHCGKICRISILNLTAISIFFYKVYQLPPSF